MIQLYNKESTITTAQHLLYDYDYSKSRNIEVFDANWKPTEYLGSETSLSSTALANNVRQILINRQLLLAIAGIPPVLTFYPGGLPRRHSISA